MTIEYISSSEPAESNLSLYFFNLNNRLSENSLSLYRFIDFCFKVSVFPFAVDFVGSSSSILIAMFKACCSFFLSSTICLATFTNISFDLLSIDFISVRLLAFLECSVYSLYFAINRCNSLVNWLVFFF